MHGVLHDVVSSSAYLVDVDKGRLLWRTWLRHVPKGHLHGKATYEIVDEIMRCYGSALEGLNVLALRPM
jgi:hypothetical protein